MESISQTPTLYCVYYIVLCVCVCVCVCVRARVCVCVCVCVTMVYYYTQEDIDSPAQRSQMSRQLHHRDSVDGKQEVTSSVPPSNGNNTNKDGLNKMVLKPDDVREEASLTSYDEPDSSSLVTSSLSSSNIELGSDPLSRSPSISEQRKIRSAQSSPYLNRANKPVETRTDSSDKRSSSYNTLSGYQQPAKTVVRYGIHLTLEDHNRLQRFLEEFVTRGLLPHLEQLTRTMNERVSTNHFNAII